jgi:hypothetical protein
VSGSIGAGAISDLGTGPTPATNTVNANLQQLDADVRAPLAAGTNVIGNVGAVPVSSGGLKVASFIVAANSTSVAIDASPGQIYGIAAYGVNGTTPVWLKLYNATQGSTTCGTGTPVERHLIATQTTGAGVVLNLSPGVTYSAAITACVVQGIADSDSTAPPSATNYVVTIYYK